MKADFDRFYKENIDRIYRYVFFRVGRNKSVAEDLVSEIFIKAYQAFDRFDENISRSAWIYRIAHNHLANHFRDRKETVDLDEVGPTLIGERGEETLERHEAEATLERALGALPPEDRRLVTMKYLEGYSYEEMGSVLGRASDALKVATHRAMKKLRDQTKRL